MTKGVQEGEEGGYQCLEGGAASGSRQLPDCEVLEPLSSCRPEPFPALLVTCVSHGPATAQPQRAEAKTTTSVYTMG